MAARNLELREKISGSFNHADSLIRFRSAVAIVDGLVDGNGKLNLSLFPDFMFTSVRNAGTNLNGTTTFADILAAIKTNLGLTDESRLNGAFMIAGQNMTINASTNHKVMFNDEGAASTTTANLNKGDHIVFIGAVDNGTGLCYINDVGAPEHTSSGACTGAGGTWVVGLEYRWSVINNNHDEAVAGASAGASTGGLISAAMIYKLANIEDQANKYTHPTFTPTNQDLTNLETIDTITFNNGHISAITKQTIRAADTSDKGVVELATTAEMQTGTDTARAATPAGVKAAIEYFGMLKKYNSIATDDVAASAAHPNGAFALFAI